jgi:hypothetical protein
MVSLIKWIDLGSSPLVLKRHPLPNAGIVERTIQIGTTYRSGFRFQDVEADGIVHQVSREWAAQKGIWTVRVFSKLARFLRSAI